MGEHMFEFIPKLPHYSKRIKDVSSIIVHYISACNTKPKDPFNIVHILNILNTYKLSYHYIIDRDGGLHLIVPPKLKAWHAGESELFGEEDTNQFSIGICLVGGEGVPFTLQALNTFVTLVQCLRKTYTIPLNRIVGHCHVSPGRKIDPGAHFPWEVLDRI